LRFLPLEVVMRSPEANAKPLPAGREAGRQQPSPLVPVLVVLFAILFGLVLYAWGPDGTAPQPNYRADAPPAAR
jgi:hypothetical protein